MIQLKYAWKELIKKPGRYVPLYIQIIVSIVLFSFIVKEINAMNQFRTKLMNYTQHNTMYVSKLQGDPILVMDELFSETGEERCKELYEFINERGSVYVQMPVSILVFGQIQETILAVNNNFCDLYDIKITDGRTFTKEELSGDLQENVIPVLVGEKKAEEYPIGTKIEFNNQQLQVVGVIDSNSFYLTPSTERGISYFTEEMVMPWIPDRHINGANGSYNDINLYNLLQIETKDPKVLDEIMEKAKELHLFELSFISYEERLGELDYYYKLMYEREFVMLGAILLYCIVGSITMLLQYIKSNIRQFSIHILCGARKNDMITRMFLQIGIPVVIGMIIVGFVFQNSLSLIAGIVFGVGVLLLIMLIPAWIWNKIELSQILKRYD